MRYILYNLCELWRTWETSAGLWGINDQESLPAWRKMDKEKKIDVGTSSVSFFFILCMLFHLCNSYITLHCNSYSIINCTLSITANIHFNPVGKCSIYFLVLPLHFVVLIHMWCVHYIAPPTSHFALCSAGGPEGRAAQEAAGVAQPAPRSRPSARRRHLWQVQVPVQVSCWRLQQVGGLVQVERWCREARPARPGGDGTGHQGSGPVQVGWKKK